MAVAAAATTGPRPARPGPDRPPGDSPPTGIYTTRTPDRTPSPRLRIGGRIRAGGTRIGGGHGDRGGGRASAQSPIIRPSIDATKGPPAGARPIAKFSEPTLAPHPNPPPRCAGGGGRACSLPPRSVGRTRRPRPPRLPRAKLAPSPHAAWGGCGGPSRRCCRGPSLLPPPAQRGADAAATAADAAAGQACSLPPRSVGEGWGGGPWETPATLRSTCRGSGPVLPTPARQANSVGYTFPEEHVPTDRLARGAFHPGPGFQPGVSNPFPGRWAAEPKPMELQDLCVGCVKRTEFHGPGQSK